MDTFFFRTALVVFFVLLAGACRASQPEPPVAVKTDGLPPHVAEKVRDRAAQGITPLRRYVTSTRMVNELDLRSIIREDRKPDMSLNVHAEPQTMIAKLER